jgi:hypothetical protein
METRDVWVGKVYSDYCCTIPDGLRGLISGGLLIGHGPLHWRRLLLYWERNILLGLEAARNAYMENAFKTQDDCSDRMDCLTVKDWEPRKDEVTALYILNARNVSNVTTIKGRYSYIKTATTLPICNPVHSADRVLSVRHTPPHRACCLRKSLEAPT